MTDASATVTPLRPRKADVTAAERQRRRRQRQRGQQPVAAVTVATVADVTAVDVTASRPDVTPVAVHGPSRVPWSVWPLACTTVALMAVSLTHLSDGVTQLTAIPSWQTWAMAVGIDCMLISVALAQLTAPPDVKRDIALVARCMEGGTLVMSPGLNALAFTGGAFDAAHWAQIAFGCFVPAAISGATYILARLTRR
jgi:hypothetical protein